MKKGILVAAMAVLGTTSAFAQYAGTQISDRIGHGQDSIDCLMNYSTYKEYYKSKNYRDAYEPWKVCFQKAPVMVLGLYTDGVNIMHWMITEGDQAQRQENFDMLMKVYDQRIQYMDALNSFSSAKNQTLKGTVLCRKAYDYSEYGGDAETAYQMLREAMNEVNNSENENEEVYGYILGRYFDLSYAKFKADSNHREQFIKDYMESKEICDRMLAKANEETNEAKKQAIIDQYDPAGYNIEMAFAESKAADKDELVKIFTPKVEENKANLDYLKSVLAIMSANDADDTDIYYKAAEYAYNIQPTFESAMGTAQRYYKEGKTAESVKYFNDALDLCPNDKQKGSIAYKIAAAQAKSGNSQGAFSYLEKAKQFNPAMSGRCSFLSAQIYAQQKNYDKAIEMCNLAASQDATVSGAANRMKEKIATVKARNAEINAYNAARAAEKAKKDKEDAFWNAK
ncbi:MAG: tetratricopeptide repeat protein [Bacteroidaceae bacterium]|nr:tetratricopeptide repeat protein [Bacteroidaceae bacterium]MDO4956013.1 tetratricopeptide repeat protein [Bacteroidales bacterium]